MKYNTIDEVPVWAAVPVRRLIDEGVIRCNDQEFEFTIDDDFLHIVVILFRLGII